MAGVRYGPDDRRWAHQALEEEAHAPRLEVRRQMCWAGDNEAYAPGKVREGAHTQAMCKEVNVPGR